MGMGAVYNFVGSSPVTCFNAAKSWQLKWYISKIIVVDPSADDCFEGNVYGIADYGKAESTVALVKIDDESAMDFISPSIEMLASTLVPWRLGI